MLQNVYLIPQEPVIIEENIKKSRFITHLAHTPSIDQAKTFIHSVKNQYKDAGHHCWAFVAGNPKDSILWGCSDDGEPAGTAGRPMLAQLSGSQVGEVTAVVARYFGGTKLGTGGLVKAYSNGVKQALCLLATQEKVFTTQLTLTCRYDQVAVVEHAANAFQAEITHRDYREDVVITLVIPDTNMQAFSESVQNKSGGKIVIAVQQE